MKSKKEIEQLAANLANPNVWKTTNWIEGYTQCQQDMADKKYTEEDVINIVNKSRQTGLTAEYLILQLNKQD